MTGLRFYKKPVPRNIHPVLQLLWQEANDQQASWKALEERSGVDASGIARWSGRSSPSLKNLEAVMNVLGYTITAKRLK